jgi:O-antigen/teichoic acid export membrane protein
MPGPKAPLPPYNQHTLRGQADVLRAPDTGARVVRGSALRGGGYVAGVLLVAAASVLLLRYLGVAEFGRYVTVMALIGIVSGVTDAGLTAIGNRELAVSPPGERRRRLLANLVTLRLAITPVGVLLATAFALVAGYEPTMVKGTLLAGAGLVLVNTQATLMLPLSVELRNARLTVAELLKQVGTVVGIATLVIAGASLLPFFAIQIGVGALIVVATPAIVGRDWWPGMRADRDTLRMLFVEALPMAAALALNVIYFRALVIVASLVSTATETGYVATSFRIFEVLLGIPTIVLGVALPVLSAAATEDTPRLGYVLQRMSEVGLATAALLAVLLLIAADPIIRLLGGSQYADAAPVLRIQGFALLGLFLGQAWQLGLVAIRQQRSVAIANGIALVAVLVLGLTLIPAVGAEGAGIAAVVAETLLAAILYFMLRRHKRAATPSLGFAWKVVLASAVAVLPLALGLPELVAAGLAALLFVGVGWVTQLAPPELIAALAPRGR